METDASRDGLPDGGASDRHAAAARCDIPDARSATGADHSADEQSHAGGSRAVDATEATGKRSAARWRWSLIVRRSRVAASLAALTTALGMASLGLWIARAAPRPTPASPPTPVPAPSIHPARSISPSAAHPADRAVVRFEEVPRYYEAVGTVRAAHSSMVGSKLMARILEVRARPGDRVTQGQVLVVLDDQVIAAKVSQAQAAVAQARATQDLAFVSARRLTNLLDDRAATRQEVDAAQSAYRSASAQVAQAGAALDEARVMRDFTVVKAPMAGLVVEKRVEAGDLALPGQTLLTLDDPSALEVEAGFPEDMADRLKVGQVVRVVVPAAGVNLDGTLQEIVPAAEPASRQVRVKAVIAATEPLRPGMFARVRLEAERQRILVIPQEAVHRTGQIESVTVLTEDGPRTRLIRTGNDMGGMIEVLAGLDPGEEVALTPRRYPSEASGAFAPAPDPSLPGPGPGPFSAQSRSGPGGGRSPRGSVPW